jgi:NADH dehydrogenase (ubiquinone) 1 alpha subcomplex subunit 5
MRSSARLLANVTKYLEANTPTGLTGLTTHPAPRPALIYTYKQTLKSLQQIPQCVYRKSVENLTKHRLAIVETEVPEGYEAWKERVRKQLDASPQAYEKFKNEDGSYSHDWISLQKAVPWDGEVTRKSARSIMSKGLADAEAKAKAAQAEIDEIEREEREGPVPTVEDIEVEPPLTAQQ